MPDHDRMAVFRRRIEAMLAALDGEDAKGRDGQRTVTLDQQSVGRLSRMDALQGQAMALATQARRNRERARLTAALERIDSGEFGYCVDCGEDIAEERLTLDPGITLCISCARG